MGPWRGRLILTPNPTEAGILLGRDAEDLETDVAEIARRFGAVVSCQGLIAGRRALARRNPSCGRSPPATAGWAPRAAGMSWPGRSPVCAPAEPPARRPPAGAPICTRPRPTGWPAGWDRSDSWPANSPTNCRRSCWSSAPDVPGHADGPPASTRRATVSEGITRNCRCATGAVAFHSGNRPKLADTTRSDPPGIPRSTPRGRPSQGIPAGNLDGAEPRLRFPAWLPSSRFRSCAAWPSRQPGSATSGHRRRSWPSRFPCPGCRRGSTGG